MAPIGAVADPAASVSRSRDLAVQRSGWGDLCGPPGKRDAAIGLADRRRTGPVVGMITAVAPRAAVVPEHATIAA